jgi:Ca2+-transporting ATPase
MVPVLLGGPMVLMPVHIILMELIIDPACSVGFEMEPAEAGLMRRPPRDPQQRLFTSRFVFRSLAQGAGAMTVTIVVYLGALRSGLSELDVRTLTFATLIVANLALIFTNRSLAHSILDNRRAPNHVLWILGASALGVLAAVLFVPFLRDLFRLATPHPDDLLVVMGAGLASLAWMEIVKRAARARQI